ncbi:hypothetical protein ACKKBG_A30845 [Auxenochlorella protothecoides x Auxenochlorella symbiontica]
MRTSVLVFIACLGAASATSSLRTAAFHDDVLIMSQSDPQAAFQRWARFYGKTYSPAEESQRLEAFMANAARVAAHQAQNAGASYTLGLNGHADLTTEEFRLRYFGEQPRDMLALRAAATAADNGKKSKYFRDWPYGHTVPPAAVDWTAEGMITPVKDQHVNGSKCGCCFAFSGVAGIEAANALYTGGDLVTLSEQQIVDCDAYDWGCDGGSFVDVMRYTIDNGGLVPDAEWPYAAKETVCHRRRERKRAAVTIDYIVNLPEANETALEQALAHTPTNVAMCCGDFIDAWHLYTGGIFNESAHCTEPIDHALLAVGYGTEPNGDKFFKIKNSWGAHWGEAGYMKVRRGIADPKGSNGVALMPGYAVKTRDNPRPDAALVGRRSGGMITLADI